MATFDGHVRRVGEYVGALRGKGRAIREFNCSQSVEALRQGLPIRVGARANPRIILRGDTFIELGSPDAGSCGFVLWTDTPALIQDGRITLVGPDIPESPAARLPFGQVVLVGGKTLGNEEHLSLGQAQYVADQIEGYMLKSSARSLWGRVSKDAAAKGFSFETLGQALMLIFRSSLPKVEAMEIVFVTSAKEDVLGLDEIARDTSTIGAEIVKEHWKAKGYDLDCDLHCGSCSEKNVCDDIRKVVASQLRKAQKDASPSPAPLGDRSAEEGRLR